MVCKAKVGWGKTAEEPQKTENRKDPSFFCLNHSPFLISFVFHLQKHRSLLKELSTPPGRRQLSPSPLEFSNPQALHWDLGPHPLVRESTISSTQLTSMSPSSSTRSPTSLIPTNIGQVKRPRLREKDSQEEHLYPSLPEPLSGCESQYPSPCLWLLDSA